MARLVVDSGALIALDRGDRHIASALELASRDGVEAVTSSACSAEVWRVPARQARLARALAGMLQLPLDADAARACGRLLARSKTSDVVDAAVALLVRDGDTVVTSDPDDIAHLLHITGTNARVRRV